MKAALTMLLPAIWILFLVPLGGCSLWKSSPDTILDAGGAQLSPELRGKFTSQSRLAFEPEALRSFGSEDGQVLKIFSFPVKNEEEGLELARRRSFDIASLFKDSVAPYSGKITVKASCLDLNHTTSSIEKTPAGFRVRYDLRATANFVYGSCSEEQDRYQSQYLLLFCKAKKTLFEARFFYSKTDLIYPNDVISCQ